MWYKYSLNKLVRSKLIEEDSENRKLIVQYDILNDKEYKAELIKKFHEEALEVIEAQDLEELKCEIADCYEAIDSILEAYGIKKEKVLEEQQRKRQEKGGLEKRYFLHTIQFNSKDVRHAVSLEYIEQKDDIEKYKLVGIFDKHIIDFIIEDKKNNKIFIQKRSKTRKSYPDVWELPGGTLEDNETIPEMIARELKEDLNLDLVKINRQVYSSSYMENAQNNAYTVFEIDVSGWENFKLEEGKADKFMWVSKNELEVLSENRESNLKNPVLEAIIEFFEQGC